MDTDRNLLFGVLAMQADLVTADQFANACALWAADKSRSLADILVRLEWLDPADRADVEKLLQRKLTKHKGNASASLAEATTDRIRQSLDGLADPDIRQSLAGLTPPPIGHVLLATTEHVAEERERYTLTRLHATGGLGRVWLARDDSLGRDVALKDLRPDRASNPATWARFLREARVTGQLEHPNIVPVYEVGRRADDQPFYTMRFVRGRTLAEAARAFHREGSEGKPLALRELLMAFVGVCNAVAYAHSRGVIHRDLKPQNVVLGGYGEVLVLDWGLAKVTGAAMADDPAVPAALTMAGGDAPDRTVAGQVLGTPAYMAPEQAEGRLDHLDVRTDVYGLGAVLYEVLTGRPPFSGDDTATVLRRVTVEPPRRPRSIAASTPAALEAACLKALSKKSADRYASAKELADEVQHWLADEPVAAYRESLAARSSRYLRRHRTVAATAATLLLAAVAASTVGVILIGGKNFEIERKRQEAVTARAQAEQERDRAEGNFNLARDAVEKTLTGVAENPRLKASDFHELRRELLQSAVPFYVEFSKQKSDDQQLEAQRGDALLRLALLRAEMGERAEAIDDYRRMQAVFAKLTTDCPQVPEYRRELARSLNNLGLLLNATGQIPKAEQAHRDALATLAAGPPSFPNVPAYRQEMAAGHNNLGAILRATGRFKEAEKSWRDALAVRRTLAAEFPMVAEYRQDLAASHNHLGALLTGMGQFPEAEQAYDDALAIQKALVDDFPRMPNYRLELARTHNNLGALQHTRNQLDKAEQAFGNALTIRKALAADFPRVPEYRQELSGVYNNLANLYRITKRPKEAERAFRDALVIHKALVVDFPNVPGYRYDLSRGYNNLGILLGATGRLVEADQAFRDALVLKKALVVEFPNIPDYQNDLAGSLVNLARLRQEAKEFAGIAPLLDEALPHHEAALRANPTNPVYVRLQRNSRLIRIAGLLGLSEHAAAAAAAETFFATVPGTGNDLYDAACFLAQCAPLADRDDKLPPADRTRLASRYADRALSLLREAVAKGYADLNQLEKDSDLDPVRQRPEFQKLLKELRDKQAGG